MTKAQRKPKSQVPSQFAGWWGEDVESFGTMLLRDGNGNGNAKPDKYDLEERTARFGEAIIRFAKQIPQNPVNNRLIDQLVGAGTSTGNSFLDPTTKTQMNDAEPNPKSRRIGSLLGFEN